MASLAEQRYRLLRRLRDLGTWTSGADLAEYLGVSERSVRTYVQKINRSGARAVVLASKLGYRLDADAYHEEVVAIENAQRSASATQQRMWTLLHALLNNASTTDPFAVADDLGVSVGTIDSDLRRARPELARYGLGVVRDQSWLRLEGHEEGKRRLLAASWREMLPGQILELSAIADAYPSYDVVELKDRLTTILFKHALDLNAYVSNDLVLNIVVALDRISGGFALVKASDGRTPSLRVAAATRELISYLERDYGVRINTAEQQHLDWLIATRTTLLGHDALDSSELEDKNNEDVVALVRDIVMDVADRFSVELNDEPFIRNLGLHVGNLLARGRRGQSAENPLALAVKESHPFVHELAVLVGQRIELATGVAVDEGEIGFLALHIGGCLARRGPAAEQVSVALVVPHYYDMADDLTRRLAHSLGAEAEVTTTITTLDTAWDQIVADVVVTPVDLAGLRPERQVRVGPLLNPDDIEKVRIAVRASQRRSGWLRLVNELLEIFDRNLFFRVPAAGSHEEVIKYLSDAMRDAGIVSDQFGDEVLERERMSATAFGEGVAVPHALTMTANRTGIAVLLTDEPIDWSGVKVRLVLLVGFNAAERKVFRYIFDQLIVVLTEPRMVQRLVERGQTFESFIAELTTLMDQ